MFRIKLSDVTKEYAKMALTVTGSVTIGYVLFFILALL
jgi:hypothetical protein